MRAAPLLSGLLALLGPAMSAVEVPVRVTSSRALRITIVDESKEEMARHPLHREFAAAMSTALGGRAIDAVALKTDYAKAAEAAARIHAGECDAVVFVGSKRPKEFRRTDTAIYAGNFGPNFNFAHAYLIVADGDPRVRTLLLEAFPLALGFVPAPIEAPKPIARDFVAQE